MLVSFSQNQNQALDKYSALFKIHYYQSFPDWKKSRIIPSAFVIEGSDEKYILSILNDIRQDNEAFAFLCFTVEAMNGIVDYLADGQLSQPVDLQKSIQNYTDLDIFYKKKDKTSISYTDRLIKYLWLRPDFVLQPYHEWQHTRYYRYPLLEVLSQHQTETFGWIRELVSTGMLEPVALVDRQAECTYCRSSHLSFIDICPKCRSLDIDIHPFLHCFTCGHVNVQEKFMHSGTLVCPNCHTQLRHIGSDYDRPLENHACHSCGEAFIDSEVLVRCAMCQKEMNLANLASNKIYNWRLSNKARIIAAREKTLNITTGFGQKDFISNELFTFILDWQLVLSQRYPNMNFSLCGIHFVNLAELTEILGHTYLLQILEAFAERLKSLLRTPDLLTRTAENMLWVLLPHIEEKGLSGFHKRIENNLKQLLQEKEQKLDYRLISIASHQIDTKQNAELLLAYLQGKLL